MRWIITTDHWGNCLGLGEDADGVPTRGTPDQGDALPMAFRLHDARGAVLFEGRCGDIDADWWHGYELLAATSTTFRCRRLSLPPRRNRPALAQAQAVNRAAILRPPILPGSAAIACLAIDSAGMGLAESRKQS